MAELMFMTKAAKDATLSLQTTLFRKLTIFEHPPYKPDLAQGDYHVFPDLKQWLGGQRFQTDVELKDTVTTHFQSLAATFYEEGIAKLAHRYDKCHKRQDDCVEKISCIVHYF